MLRYQRIWFTIVLWALKCLLVTCVPPVQAPLRRPLSEASSNHDVSPEVFADLEESSRIVDIAYCVGLTGTGIQKPFLCASRCQEFANFELVTTWNTGFFLSDSCGYIAISHPPSSPRIIVAFRGTYSITNTIIDLSTIPQEYIPYPGRDDDCEDRSDESACKKPGNVETAKCVNCTVHAGFMTSWRHTRPYIVPHLRNLLKEYPGYQLTLIGHSLGGAVAAIASLELHAYGWNPQVTTFGEPRIGNSGLTQFIDETFPADSQQNASGMYRRVTHVDDPVPLLPLSEWGYQMHAGEIYISKPNLPPSISDLRRCKGDEDPECIAGAEAHMAYQASINSPSKRDMRGFKKWEKRDQSRWAIPPRFRIWQLLFAHRDYFWRLGLCIPGGDPADWYRE